MAACNDRFMRRPLVGLAVLAIAATGCTDGKAQPPKTDSTRATSAAVTLDPSSSAASPTPSKPPENNPAAAAALGKIAGKSAAAAYDGTYDFNAARAQGILRIVADPPQFRVDITSAGRLAQFFQIGLGTVSCAKSQDKPVVCALVAKPGEKVPDVFDPRVQRLFTDGLDALAKNPDGYSVSALPDMIGAAAGVPAGKCFHVSRLADLATVSPGMVTDPGRGFETGDYCFDPASAVLTSVRVATGTLTLRKAPAVPTDADFTPPATPQPLDPNAASAAATASP